jgi:oligopeptide/dipeptide ABC transporter ATP-binding protein
VRGEALFLGRDLLKLSKKELQKIRGGDVAMIFQDPMTSLNPVLKIGYQLAEAVRAHNSVSEKAARERAVGLLTIVGVPNPERRYDQYPHEFSGGMRQRAMIAMAMANDPKLLIADEPTTALDVTIQAQILEALQAAQEETNAAIIMITHDLGLIAELADRVAVMYAGKVVEMGDVFTIFEAPRHPYTIGLMRSVPRVELELDELEPIPGSPPSLIARPPGCAFHPRCTFSRGRAVCRSDVPSLDSVGSAQHLSACHFAAELEAQHLTGVVVGGAE